MSRANFSPPPHRRATALPLPDDALQGPQPNRLRLALAATGLALLAACGPASVAPTATPPVAPAATPTAPAATPTAPAATPTAAATTPSPVMASPTPRETEDPRGPSVTINGLQIFGHCTGDRPSPDVPVVVLQSGTGGSAAHLAGIERHMSPRTMVCSWSRPGVNPSDTPDDLPRPVSEVVAEMRAILAAIGAEPPYFFVGQSGGAVITFMFAQAYADEVAGFVAINPNPAYSRWMETAEQFGFPEEFVEGAEADYRGHNPEGIDFTGNDRMLTDPLPPTIPYAVMYDEECGQEECAEILAPEAAVQELLAGVGEGGRFVWAHGAGHEIPETQPELVYATIDEVWAEAAE